MADRRRRDLLALTLVAVLLRLPAVLSSRQLSFDDGVYGATAIALRHGARPYRDVFSSQGPLHQPLIYLADLLGLRTSVAPRLLSLVSAVVITLCTYLAARAVADRRAGLVAALLATTAGSVLLVTTGISGDGPAIAFAIAAVSVALAARDHDGWVRPVVAGLLVGAACSVKLLAAPAVLVVGLLLWNRRRPGQLLAAAATAVAVPLVLAAPWGYARVWSQSVAYHREARRYTVPEAAWRIVTTLFERDLFVAVTAVVVVVAALLARAAWRPSDLPVRERAGTVFGMWLGVQVGLLLAEAAMWRPHVSELVVPL
jgi:4-amino-4-deoxy-L-arabinose transferase-like glycosyltransferase